MKRTTAIIAGAVIAVSGVAGATTMATANNVTYTCLHGTAYNNSGHKQVVFEGSRYAGREHWHRYKHDVKWAPDHHPERRC